MGDLTKYVVTPGVGNVYFTPSQLKLIGEVAGATGRVELNSFMQLIIHTEECDLSGQQERLRAAGLGVYPAGAVVKNIHTCTFCMGERIEGLPDAQRLDSLVAGTPTPFPVRVGFSGCANNCGEARLRDIGVVLMAPGDYAVYLGGKPGGLEPLLAERVAEAVPADRLGDVVTSLLTVYRTQARGKERLWRTVARLGLEPFQAAVKAALEAKAE